MKTRKSLVATYAKIILVILIIVAVIYGVGRVLNREYNNEEYKTVKTNLLLIQGKTKVISEQLAIEEERVTYISTEIKEKQNDAKIQNLINNNIINIESENNIYYCIDNNNLEELGLGDIQVEDYFIVDYKQNDVIFVNGIEDKEGNLVYKLSDME